MNKINLIWIQALLLLAFGLNQGCNKASCNNVDCGEFGDCVELTESTLCRCQTGYEKDDDELCNIKSSGRYLGNWSATELRFDNDKFTQETLSYDVSISEDANEASRIRFSNLGNLDNSFCNFSEPIEVLATVSVQNISVVNATYCPGGQFSGYNVSSIVGTDTISGSGDRIQMNFRLTYTDKQGKKDFDCDVTLERK